MGAYRMQQFGPLDAFLEKVSPELASSFVDGVISSTNDVQRTDAYWPAAAGPLLSYLLTDSQGFDLRKPWKKPFAKRAS